MRSQAKVVARLRGKQERLLASRDSLLKKLDMVMGPKIKIAENKIQKEEKAAGAATKSESEWAAKADNLKQLALKAVKTRDEAKTALEATEKKLAEIQAELQHG